MVLTSEKTGAGRIRRKRSKGDFKGVRMRKWGRWVSEIRVPQSRSRIWLGSYDTAEKAARAYDAALYCLRGSEGKFNFPDEKRPELPDGSPTSYSKAEIIAVASRFALPSSLSVPSSTSSLTSAASSAEAPILAGETGSACDAVNSHFASGMAEPDMFSPTSYSKTEIEAVASWFESLSSPSVPSSTSSLTSTTSSPEAPNLVGETGSTCNAGNSQFASGVVEPDMVSPTSDSKTEIKAVSPWFASLSSLSVLSSASSLTSAASSAEAPILGGETGSTCDAVNSHFASGMAEPDMFSPTSYSKTEIEAVASWFESLSSPSVPFSTSSLMSTTSSPEEPILAGETGCTCDVGNLHFASGVVEPNMFSPTSDSRTVIEAVSPWFASPSSLSFPFSSSLTSITSSPEAPILVGETGSTCDAGDSNFASGIVELDMFSPENFLLEEPIMLEPNCM